MASLRSDRNAVPAGWLVKDNNAYGGLVNGEWYGDPDLEGERRAETGAAKEPRNRPAPARKMDARLEAVQVWLDNYALQQGYELTDLLGAIRPGRPTKTNTLKLDVLAKSVLQLRPWRWRVPTDTLCAALGGVDRKTVERLEKRGRSVEARELEQVRQEEREQAERREAIRSAKRQPCPRHSDFHEDCPGCLRNAPDEALSENPTGTLLGAYAE